MTNDKHFIQIFMEYSLLLDLWRISSVCDRKEELLDIG